MSSECGRVRALVEPDEDAARVTSLEQLADALADVADYGPEPEGAVVEIDADALDELPEGWCGRTVATRDEIAETIRENEFLVGAFGVYTDADDIGDEVWIGDLVLTRDGERWQVNQREQLGTEEMVAFVDAIRPSAFPSARVLAAYLRELEDRGAGGVDLPEAPDRYVGPVE